VRFGVRLWERMGARITVQVCACGGGSGGDINERKSFFLTEPKINSAAEATFPSLMYLINITVVGGTFSSVLCPPPFVASVPSALSLDGAEDAQSHWDDLVGKSSSSRRGRKRSASMFCFFFAHLSPDQ
jgi:hypothetical protein